MPYSDSKPELKAVVEKTFVPAHEEFFHSEDGERYWSIEYPNRTHLKIVGWEPVE